MKKPTLIVLAAGMGSRYGGLKQLDSFGPAGESIIDYSVYDAILSGFGKIVFVIRESFKKDFFDLFHHKLHGKIDYALVCQDLEDLPEGYRPPAHRKKPWGTGHAVWVCRQHVQEAFGVINADDFYGREAIQTLSRYLQNPDNRNYGVVSYRLKNTLSEFGAVNRGICFADKKGFLKHVVETKGIFIREGRILYEDSDKNEHELETDTLVSMNMWGFGTSYFKYAESYFKAFLDSTCGNDNQEFYIPSLVQDLIDQKELNVDVLGCDAQWFGVTYQEDKPR